MWGSLKVLHFLVTLITYFENILANAENWRFSNAQTYINIAQHTQMRKSNLLISANKESHRRSTSETIQRLSLKY